MAKPNGTETLERGHIYFLYRPRVENENPAGVGDIQRLYVVLSPAEKERYRLAVLGTKRLPQASQEGAERNWGFIEMVRKKPQSITKELKAATYKTKTRGERQRPAARPLGEGVYRILRHGDHTHLVYALELPEKPGEPQRQMHVDQEASYIISIKNPAKGSPKNAGLSGGRQARYPRKLMQVFEDKRFADADPPEFLDHEGAEFVLVAASEDIQEELGIRLDTQHETQSSADMFKDLHLDRSKHPVKPLFTGEWA
ncbi:MAG: hypothetical protein C4519_00555 [Desulfobacteraceae bacterium]|nr:MAG: hypothetical protein C4519_00555 [Desulfobacteraceae bacterium]